MEQLLYYLILLFLSFCFSIFQGSISSSVLAFLFSVAIACYSYVFPKRKSCYFLQFVYWFLSLWNVPFLLFTPIVLYASINNYILHHLASALLLLIVPILCQVQNMEAGIIFLIICGNAISFFLKRQYLYHQKLQSDFIRQRDNTKELALLLSEQNRNIMIRQEQDIRIATLDERNRIAREIHDNVGHLLSSALLQVGALQTLCKQEDILNPLQNLRTTISTGMDRVRSSVHDLHDDALNLEMAIHELMESFHFCPITLTYTISNEPSQKMMYQILPIIKEALNNTMRHSDANKVSLVFREQTTFYQLIILDNGAKKAIKTSGIGLKNMEERVSSMNGYINIDNHEGFQIFITIPKEESV